MYTYESLEVLTKSTLLSLAEYNDVPDVNMRMLKGDMIEKIIEYMKSKPEEVVAETGESLLPVSVRIQRIRDSQEIS